MGKSQLETTKEPNEHGKLMKNVLTLRDYYFYVLDKIWSKIPNFLGTLIATVVVFIAGATMRGDWLLILVHFIKQIRYMSNSTSEIHNNQEDYEEMYDGSSFFSLERYRLQGLPYFWLINFSFSYTMYFGICGFLQWYFYMRQKSNQETWKCQPYKNLSPYQERHEIISGTINVGIGSVIFGAGACYIHNGGYTALYNRFDEYGWTWLILSIPVLFFWQDFIIYWTHRFTHIPFLYKNFHKWHHLYKQPTAFSVTAFHPVEFVFYQMIYIMPSLVVPLHTVVYLSNLLYIYYFGLVDHSGVKMESIWPWQPNTTYHDNHHQYFNVNYGFNLDIWDKYFNTYRLVDCSMKKKGEKDAFRDDEETLRLEQEYMHGKIK